MSNEKRLIRADVTVEAFTEWLTSRYDGRMPADIVNEIPTVDAVEVVHGKWIVTDADSGEPGSYAAYIEVNCSKCGYSLGAESGQYGWYLGDPFPLRYCPNCGAKMNGGTSP